MKIAVHCKTEEEWNKVLVKIDKVDHTAWRNAFHDYRNPCINPDDPATCDKTYYKERGYTIISAQEYLNEFKVGDRVEILSGCITGNSDLIGKVGQITNIHKSSDNPFRVETKIFTSSGHNYGWFKEVKLATKPKTTEETMSIVINSTVAKVFTDIPTAQMVTRCLGKEYEEDNHRAYLDLNRDKESVLAEAQRLEDIANKEV